jgi:hypothetical protein
VEDSNSDSERGGSSTSAGDDLNAYLLDAAREHWPAIRGLYEQFEEKRPVMLFDIQEQRVYAYPYDEFMKEVSARSQRSLQKQYEQAIHENSIVVFVRDNEQRRLVSFSVEWELRRMRKKGDVPAALRAVTTRTGAIRPARKYHITLDRPLGFREDGATHENASNGTEPKPGCALVSADHGFTPMWIPTPVRSGSGPRRFSAPFPARHGGHPGLRRVARIFIVDALPCHMTTR